MVSSQASLYAGVGMDVVLSGALFSMKTPQVAFLGVGLIGGVMDGLIRLILGGVGLRIQRGLVVGASF